METIIAAVIAAVATLAAPLVVARFSTKIKNTKQQVEATADEAESAVDQASSVVHAQWLIIDRQRLDIARLEQELRDCRGKGNN